MRTRPTVALLLFAWGVQLCGCAPGVELAGRALGALLESALKRRPQDPIVRDDYAVPETRGPQHYLCDDGERQVHFVAESDVEAYMRCEEALSPNCLCSVISTAGSP